MTMNGGESDRCMWFSAMESLGSPHSDVQGPVSALPGSSSVAIKAGWVGLGWVGAGLGSIGVHGMIYQILNYKILKCVHNQP